MEQPTDGSRTALPHTALFLSLVSASIIVSSMVCCHFDTQFVEFTACHTFAAALLVYKDAAKNKTALIGLAKCWSTQGLLD